jgi:hypothetical protein
MRLQWCFTIKQITYLPTRSSECQISEEELHSMEETRAEHSLFVQELLLSSLADVSLHECAAGGAASLPLTEEAVGQASGPRLPFKQQQQHPQPQASPSASKSQSSSRSCDQPRQLQLQLQQQHSQRQQAAKPTVRPVAASAAAASKQAPPPMCILPNIATQQPPVMMVTGTGTIREVPQSARNPAGSGAGLSAQASSVRRKPIRQPDPRNQPTDPPPR